MDRLVLRMTDEDQFDHDSRVARATILHEEIAKVLQDAADVPLRLDGVAPLYLAQAFAIVERREVRDSLVALLGAK